MQPKDKVVPFFKKLRKPADRLGKVVFANEVSVAGGRLPRCTEISISGGDKGGQLDLF